MKVEVVELQREERVRLTHGANGDMFWQTAPTQAMQRSKPKVDNIRAGSA